MTVFPAKITFALLCLASSVSSSIIFNKAAAMLPETAPQGNRTSHASNASESKEDNHTHNTSKPEQESSTHGVANVSKSKHMIIDILTKIETERHHVRNSSAIAIQRVSRATAVVQAMRLQAKSVEKTQAALAKELEDATSKVRATKERRLEISSLDVESISSPAVLNRSRRTMARAQAVVTTAEDVLIELARKSRAADTEARRANVNFERAMKARNHSSVLAGAVRRHIMRFGKTVSRAREHRAHMEMEMGSAVAEMQSLVATLEDALETGATHKATPDSNRSALSRPVEAASASRNASQSGNETTARVPRASASRNASQSGNEPTARVPLASASRSASQSDNETTARVPRNR